MSIPDDFQQLLQQERIANEQFLAGDAGSDEIYTLALRLYLCDTLRMYSPIQEDDR